MRNRVASIIGILLCVISSFVVGASAENFSADVVTTSSEGTFTAKMYMQDGNVRMETAEAVTITRLDKRIVWVLMPVQGMYLEQPFNSQDYIASGAARSGEIERVSLGRDTVAGSMAEKAEVTYEYEGARTTVYEWTGPSFSLPVKIAATDGSWEMEYRNIRVGEQDPALFEVPAGYRHFSMPVMPMEFGTE